MAHLLLSDILTFSAYPAPAAVQMSSSFQLDKCSSTQLHQTLLIPCKRTQQDSLSILAQWETSFHCLEDTTGLNKLLLLVKEANEKNLAGARICVCGEIYPYLVLLTVLRLHLCGIVCYLTVSPGVARVSLKGGLSGHNWAKGKAGGKSQTFEPVTMGLAMAFAR